MPDLVCIDGHPLAVARIVGRDRVLCECGAITRTDSESQADIAADIADASGHSDDRDAVDQSAPDDASHDTRGDDDSVNALDDVFSDGAHDTGHAGAIDWSPRERAAAAQLPVQPADAESDADGDTADPTGVSAAPDVRGGILSWLAGGDA